MIVELEENGGQLRFRTFKKIGAIPRIGDKFYFEEENFIIKDIEWRVRDDDFIVRLFIEGINT